MEVTKEGKYLIFSTGAKYDLSNGEVFNNRGTKVKSLTPYIRNYYLRDVINSVTDENYKNFLTFVNERFINKGSRGWTVDKITNVGTFLSRLKNFSMFEQYFSAGISKISTDIRTPVSDLPKGFISWVKKYDLKIDQSLIDLYTRMPDRCRRLMTEHFEQIEGRDIISTYFYAYNFNYIVLELVKQYNYDYFSLLHYLDDLVTFEALRSVYYAAQELKDYCRMMSAMSGDNEKFEKYPRYFLTTHAITVRNYERLKQFFDEKAFEKIVNTWKPRLEWEWEEFVFMFPSKIQDIKDEAVMQHNCVASYIQKVINGECFIMFLRLKDEKDKGNVTLEVRDLKIVQKEGSYRRQLTAKEKEAVTRIEEHWKRVSKNWLQ